MAGRHPAAMRKRDERAHAVIKDALNQGYLDTGTPYVVPGFGSHDAANEGRKSVKVGGDHLGFSTAAWVTDQDGNPCWIGSKPGYKECTDPGAPHAVRFRIHSKDKGREHVVRESGGDPSKLKYNPFQRAEGRLVDDSGNPVR